MLNGLQDISHVILFRLGASPVTVGGVAGAAMVVVLFIAASVFIGTALKRLRMRTEPGNAALYIAEKVLGYGLVLVGIVAGLSALGIDLTSLTVFAGGLGIGLGLGLQGIIKEFVSGLTLVFDRAVQIGDYVEMHDGTRGVVQEIGPRATRVRNNDNVYLLIPNSKLIENTMINWTRRGETRRIHVPFQVAIGADKERVRECVLAAARVLCRRRSRLETAHGCAVSSRDRRRQRTRARVRARCGARRAIYSAGHGQAPLASLAGGLRR